MIGNLYLEINGKMLVMWILELGHKLALVSRRVAGVEYCNTGMKFRGT